MRQGDFEIRYRLERFRAMYEAGGQRFDLFPSFIDCGFDEDVDAEGAVLTRVILPAKDFPFLWLGCSMQRTSATVPGLLHLAPPMQTDRGGVLKFTILKNAQTLGDAKSENRVINNAVDLQSIVGYRGKPALFAYPYLFEAFDQLQVQILFDAPPSFGADTVWPLVLSGYKVLPRAA